MAKPYTCVVAKRSMLFDLHCTCTTSILFNCVLHCHGDKQCFAMVYDMVMNM